MHRAPVAHERRTHGKALTCSFFGPTRYWAQDNRKWGEDWLLRFGPALDRRLHLRGEELVYRVRFASSEGVRLEKPDAVVIRADDSWTRFENRKDILEGSALDFSGQGLQDAPAGKYGWLKAVRGCSECALRPGVAQRFYGVNLCFSANFPTREEADALIVRFVRSGYNAIRIHHHDDWWAKHPESREKLDYLVARAISCGLYVTADLYVSRRATWRELGEDRPGGPSTQLYKTLVQTDERAYANWLAFAKEFRATDYYGNPRTTDGVVYCGAVQAACTNVTSGLAFRRPYGGGGNYGTYRNCRFLDNRLCSSKPGWAVRMARAEGCLFAGNGETGAHSTLHQCDVRNCTIMGGHARGQGVLCIEGGEGVAVLSTFRQPAGAVLILR